MKTAFDIVQDVRNLLNVPELLETLDGKIYQFIRPLNSDKKDITVSILSGSNDWMQEATVNVRIHSPNLSLTLENGIVDGTRPDLKTFAEISKIVCRLTDAQYMGSFSTVVTTPGIIHRQADGSFVCLVQLDYYSIQNNYKNI